MPTTLELKFIRHYVEGLSARKAAQAAGVSPPIARRWALAKIKRPEIKEAIIEEARATGKLAKKSKEYSLQDAADDCDRAIELALATKNAIAFTKAVELKSKLYKHLDKDTGVEASGFSITIGDVSRPLPLAPKQVKSLAPAEPQPQPQPSMAELLADRPLKPEPEPPAPPDPAQYPAPIEMKPRARRPGRPRKQKDLPGLGLLVQSKKDDPFDALDIFN